MPYEKHEEKRLTFSFMPGKVYLVQDEERYLVQKAAILANGTKDLCFSEDETGEINITKTEETDPEKIVLRPENDIMHINFEKSVPGIGLTLFFEITENLIPTVKDFLSSMRGIKREHYDAFIGREYPEL